MAVALCELKWLYRLLLDFHVSVPKSVPLHCDSKGAIHIAANLVFHKRTKHIKIDCHFVRNAFQAGFITHQYIRSALQLVDIFTKAL